MIGPICITPWWLRLIGKPPFRRYCISYTWDGWVYLSLAEAIQEAERMGEF